MENQEKETKMTLKEDENNYIITDFENLGVATNTKTQVFTNIKDSKELFNLENNVDFLLNDCVGEKIMVDKILIKRFEKPLENPVIDEDTGEVIKDKEISMSCAIIDEDKKTYATGSKIFAIQLMRYLEIRAKRGEQDEPFLVEITKKKFGENGNKALSFKLV